MSDARPNDLLHVAQTWRGGGSVEGLGGPTTVEAASVGANGSGAGALGG